MAVFSTNPFAGKTIAVLGDLMLDEFVFGRVERISPEAPVPVVQVERRSLTLGGAGNVVLNLKSLGLTPLVVSLVGEDSAAETVKSICSQKGIDTAFMATSTRPTTCKTRVVAESQHIVRVDEEVSDALSPAERTSLLEKLKIVRQHADTIVVSDYAKGIVDQQMLDDVKSMWQGGHVVVDPKPRVDITYEGVTLITPNLKEAAALSGLKNAKTDEEAAQTVKTLHQGLKLPQVLLTRAGDGMTLFDNGTVEHHKTKVLDVRDVSGAGDTVIAVMAASYASGVSLSDAVKIANAAGGVVVSKVGTVAVEWPEVEAALHASAV